MSSIRARLTLTLTVALALLLGIGGVFLYAETKSRLEQNEREALEAKAYAVAAAIEVSDGKLEVELMPALAAEFKEAPRASYYELLAKDGRVLARSPSFPAGTPPIVDVTKLTRINLPDGRAGLAIGIPATLDRELAEEAAAHEELEREFEAGVRVVVAGDARDLDASLAVFRTTLIAVFGASALAGFVVVTFALRRGLAPLERMAEQVRTIDVGSLSTRFGRDEMPRELEPIRDRLDDLLGRLEKAFERESRFNSAVAHELRTPIAELRTTVEVAMRWPEPEDAPRVYADVLAIAERMQRLVSALLALRRAESGAEVLSPEPVVLRDVVDRAVERARAGAAKRGIAIDVEVPPDLELATQPDLLESIVDNWLTNAVEYAPSGSRVRVHAARDASRPAIDHQFELSVSNPAPRLGSDELPFLFEPFWRMDAARADGEHAGLGLALSRAVARALGFEASAELGIDSELRVVLRGPLQPYVRPITT